LCSKDTKFVCTSNYFVENKYFGIVKIYGYHVYLQLRNPKPCGGLYPNTELLVRSTINRQYSD